MNYRAFGRPGAALSSPFLSSRVAGGRTWAGPSLLPKLRYFSGARDPSFLPLRAALSTQPTKVAEEAPVTVDSVPVLLTVRNMKCGGCSAAVKRILLQQTDVLGAAVNLLTETAVIQVPSGTQADVAERAAKVLTDKGFATTLRAQDEDGLESTAAVMNRRREEELRES